MQICELRSYTAQLRSCLNSATTASGFYYDIAEVSQGVLVEHVFQPDYMKILKLDEDECRRRLDFFEITEEDSQRLISLRPFAEQVTHEITEGLYELIMRHPDSRVFFPDAATLV